MLTELPVQNVRSCSTCAIVNCGKVQLQNGNPISRNDPSPSFTSSYVGRVTRGTGSEVVRPSIFVSPTTEVPILKSPTAMHNPFRKGEACLARLNVRHYAPSNIALNSFVKISFISTRKLFFE